MKRRFSPSGGKIILLGFALVILLGSLLLALPISAADGRPVPYIDALFTATTSTCVTGLVTVPTVSTWSVFGQVIILLLIQIGGLGVITVLSGMMLLLHRKIGLGNRLLIQDAFNLNTLSGLVRFVKKVLVGTFIIEALGALGYMLVFVPEYGAKGIWFSVFTAVSAFCNAGIDILSTTSLCDYAGNPIINFVTTTLIILGGLGYIVWWDLARVLHKAKQQGLRCLRGLTLHSKIALLATFVLLLGGTLLFLLLEYHNPKTMGNAPFYEKLLIAFFQSVTTRTAGFFTVPQEHLTNASAFVSLVLMFIGGSPVGTAGGIKTVTVFVLLATALTTVRNGEAVTLMGRTLTKQSINKAVAVLCTSFATVLLSTLLLAAVTTAPALDILYETVSATATVGLTRNFTSMLNVWGKLIIIATMYFGRVGPISLVIAFRLKRENKNVIQYPSEEISVG